MEYKTEVRILICLGLIDVYLWILGFSSFFVFEELFFSRILDPYSPIGNSVVMILTFQSLLPIILTCFIICDWNILREENRKIRELINKKECENQEKGVEK